jgi:hypothetical protein
MVSTLQKLTSLVDILTEEKKKKAQSSRLDSALDLCFKRW